MIAETDWLGDAAAAPAPNPGGRPAKGYRGRQRKLQCGSCNFIVYAKPAPSSALEVGRLARAATRCIGPMSVIGS